MTDFVVRLVLGALKIPALGDAIGRRLRGPSPAPKSQARSLPGAERAR